MSDKITRATFKAFVRRNADNLYIKNLSDFDPMTDCVQQIDGAGFRSVNPSEIDDSKSHTLGISGVWLVGQSRDWFSRYEKDGFRGIEVYNSCGNFVVAVREAGMREGLQISAEKISNALSRVRE